MARPLPPSFYARSTALVAKELLGHVVECEFRGVVTTGRIVETEAYVGPHDPASHGYQSRRTPRNDRLFGAPGRAYVYVSYGVHWMLNAVTERADYPSAVLIRALEPVSGLDAMKRRRQTKDVGLLTTGPGRLTQACRISTQLDGHWLQHPPLRILKGEGVTSTDIEVTPRIGISSARDWPLRFVVRESRFLSRRLPRR